jgi:VCBS repeat-containing protein
MRFEPTTTVNQEIGQTLAQVLRADEPGSLRLPSSLLQGSEYSRQGPDLILTQENGEQVLIVGYFSQEAPPPLLGQFGDVYDSSLITRLAGSSIQGLLAQAGTAATLRAVGKIATLKGAATVKHADGTAGTLGKDQTIFRSDIIETAQGSAVGLTFEDGSSLSLGSKGRLVIDDLVYDPQSADNKSALNVVSGAFTMVSGNIAKLSPGASLIKTPVGAIGIRGTTVSGNIGHDGHDSYFTLMPDANGHIGEITMTNGAGTITLNQSGFSLQIGSFSQAPQQVYLSPERLQSLYGESLSSHPSPISMPPPAPPPGSNLPVEHGAQDPVKEPAAHNADNLSVSDILRPESTFFVDEQLMHDFKLELTNLLFNDLLNNDETNSLRDLLDTIFNEVDDINDLLNDTENSVDNHDPVFEGSATSSFSVVHGQSYSGNVSATDQDNDSLTYSVETNPSHGTLTLNSDGTFTYAATSSVTGASTTDSFEISVSDGAGGSVERTVTVDVTDTAPSLSQVTPKLSGLTFDGTNDIINIPTPVTFAGSDNFSIGMWVYPTAAGMLYRQQISNGTQLGIYTSVIANNALLFGLDYSGWDWNQTANNAITLNDWHHLTFIKSGSTTEIYIDGVSQGSHTITGSQTSATNPSGIVHFGDNLGGDFYNGQLAQLAVYSSALGASDVQSLMQGVPGTVNLAEYYTFATSDGVAYSDLSSNGHDLSLSGATAPVFQLQGSVSSTDPDVGDTVTMAVGANPSAGTLNFNTSTGAYSYTPDYSASSDIFQITATDDHSVSKTGVIYLPGRMTSGNDSFTATSGSELIYGGPGSDSLNGAAGNDTLYGGLANDTLFGGSGCDVFVEQTGNLKQTSSQSLMDVVQDFNWSTDADRFKIYNSSGSAVTIVGAYHAGDSGTVAAGITAAFADRDGSGSGSTGLGVNEAAFFTVSTNTYLVVNDANAGYQSGQDVVLQISGGDAIASNTTLTVGSYFS